MQFTYCYSWCMKLSHIIVLLKMDSRRCHTDDINEIINSPGSHIDMTLSDSENSDNDSVDSNDIVIDNQVT